MNEQRYVRVPEDADEEGVIRSYRDDYSMNVRITDDRYIATTAQVGTFARWWEILITNELLSEMRERAGRVMRLRIGDDGVVHVVDDDSDDESDDSDVEDYDSDEHGVDIDVCFVHDVEVTRDEL